MKRIAVLALAAMLIFTACGGGTAKSEAPAASSASPSKVESKKESNNPFADDFGYVKLCTALKEQGEVKIKANCWTTYTHKESDKLDTASAVMQFKEVALCNATLENDIVTAEFDAHLQNDLFYIEEEQPIIAKLKKTGDKYEFIEATVRTGFPATIQPNEPFTVDSLYDTGAVLFFTLYDEELEANRDLFLFNDSITVNKLTGSTAWDCEVVIPLTRENVKSIELVPNELGQSWQSLTEVNFDKTVFTLQNELILTSHSDIELHLYNEERGKWLPDRKLDDGTRGFLCKTEIL